MSETSRRGFMGILLLTAMAEVVPLSPASPPAYSEGYGASGYGAASYGGPYWVPMKEYDGGPQWRYLGRGDTPEEAREDALDTYEERHSFRPLPNGEPVEAVDVEVGR